MLLKLNGIVHRMHLHASLSLSGWMVRCNDVCALKVHMAASLCIVLLLLLFRFYNTKKPKC